MRENSQARSFPLSPSLFPLLPATGSNLAPDEGSVIRYPFTVDRPSHHMTDKVLMPGSRLHG